MSQNNTVTHAKLLRCQTQRRDMQLMTAETMQTYALLRFAVARSNGSNFLFITQYEIPFINKIEATKDRKINAFQFRWTKVTRALGTRLPYPRPSACVIGGKTGNAKGDRGSSTRPLLVFFSPFPLSTGHAGYRIHRKDA